MSARRNPDGPPRPSPPPGGDPVAASGRSRARTLADRLFDYRSIDEYLANPLAPASEPDKGIVIESLAQGGRLLFRPQVFPVYWRCMACPPDDSYNPWDMKALLDPARRYLPSCSRPNCGAPATAESVLVNAHKESIVTLGGENLTHTRLYPERYVWCCQCNDLRGDGVHRNPQCLHCAHFEQSSCATCVRCNKFLEPTRFCNGDIVRYGVLDLHCRAVARKEGRSFGPDPRFPSAALDHYLDEESEVVRLWWNMTCTSIMVGHSLLDGMPPLPPPEEQAVLPQQPPVPGAPAPVSILDQIFQQPLNLGQPHVPEDYPQVLDPQGMFQQQQFVPYPVGHDNGGRHQPGPVAWDNGFNAHLQGAVGMQHPVDGQGAPYLPYYLPQQLPGANPPEGDGQNDNHNQGHPGQQRRGNQEAP